MAPIKTGISICEAHTLDQIVMRKLLRRFASRNMSCGGTLFSFGRSTDVDNTTSSHTTYEKCLCKEIIKGKQEFSKFIGPFGG